MDEHKTQLVASPTHDAVVEHNRCTTAVIGKIKEAVIAAGHSTDDLVRRINGNYVGVFVLPSADHIYVGFGIMGGYSAYRGTEADMDPAKVAEVLIQYASKQ